MKKLHIVLLVLIAASVAVLLVFMKDVTTYATVDSALKKEGKQVQMIARLDKSQPVEYDPIKNPNYLSFTAIDTLGKAVKVVYNSPKPTDFEKSERLVLKGAMHNGQFECKNILMKCPSKYKDDVNEAQKALEDASQQQPAAPAAAQQVTTTEKEAAQQ
jgi:cytochrome c-type biogenesis protein CcmE